MLRKQDCKPSCQTNYIEVNSAYRDRTVDPNIGAFTVKLAQNGSNDKYNAVDPVSYAAPEQYWNTSFCANAQVGNANYLVEVDNITATAGDSTTDYTILYLTVTYSAGQQGQILRSEDNFYAGCVLAFSTARARILTYQLVSTSTTADTAIVKVAAAFASSTTFTSGIIGNPTTNTTLSPSPQVFIPYGQNVPNFYINYLIENVNTGEIATITGYDRQTHLATISPPTLNNWYSTTTSYNLIIREQLPTVPTNLTATLAPTFPPLGSVIVTGVSSTIYQLSTNASNVSSLYDAFFLRMLQPWASLPTDGNAYPAPYGQTIKIKQYYALDTTIQNTVGTGSTIIFGSNALSTDNVYNGYFITTAAGNTYQIATYVGATRTATITTTFNSEAINSGVYFRDVILTSPYTSNVPSPTTLQNSVGTGSTAVFGSNAATTDGFYNNYYLITKTNRYLITGYVGATKTATVSGSLNSEAMGSTVYFAPPTTGTYPYVSTVAQLNSLIEILQFSTDNFVPLSYNGSMGSMEQEVCYEIKLKNLILPNIPLNVGQGGKVVFYPYVYVEFTPLSAPYKNAIYSNNPNSTKVLFRVIVSDMTDEIISPFVKLKADDMVQTIKFKPNENFRFSVTLPDGEVFNVDATENYSPSLPNSLMQLSAIFEIKRKD